MNIKSYLDSTYLKTANQAGLSETDNDVVIKSFINEAIEENFKLVMVRPEKVKMVKEMITLKKSKLLIGSVISFHEGKNTIDEKIAEALQAIEDGADELDFVSNYEAFINGDLDLVKSEVYNGTRLGIENHKVVKWIIEVAALTNDQIIQYSALIKNVVLSNFKEDCYQNVFVKSSTGFYKTENNKPNGATLASIILMLENASPLSIKASGGVRTYEEAKELIRLGVRRIGTSSAKNIANGIIALEEY